MRFVFALFTLGLAACAPQIEESFATPDNAAPVHRAVFQTAPADMDAIFRASCNNSGDAFRQVNDSTTQCRRLPSPELAAFLVLNYDGVLEAPSVVIQQSVAQNDDLFLLELSYFAEVKQKSGNVQRVYFRIPEVEENTNRMFRAIGGTPI